MDEPTAGVDVANQHVLADVLGRLVERDVTLVIVTHELGALERLPTRIIVVDGGRIAFDGDPGPVCRRNGLGAPRPRQPPPRPRAGATARDGARSPRPPDRRAVTEILSLDFMQRALVAALLVGLVAPMVGIFLVQRRMSLIGDGMGHVALAGVAIGLVTEQPVLTALVAAVIAAVVIELLRARGRTNGDVALAIIFYGGIAAGVVIISQSPDGTPANLVKYLFGSILTVERADLLVFAVLAVVIAATTWVLRPRLFAVANDEEYARAVGLPVLALNIVLAVLTATTVVVAMRVVGLLLISALMIVPNAAASSSPGRSAAALRWAMALGLVSAVGGVALLLPAQHPLGRDHRPARGRAVRRHRRRASLRERLRARAA